MTYTISQHPHPNGGYRIQEENEDTTYVLDVFKVEKKDGTISMLTQDSDTRDFCERMVEFLNQ
jgi:hypothetical protein